MERSFASRIPQWLLGLALFVLTLTAFAPAFHAGFIWDDNTYIQDNVMLTARDGLRRIWFSLDSPSQYFPLTFTTFYFERAIWGLNPTGYHAVNIILHALNVLLLWRVLLKLRVPGAWLGAALFAIHPVQVESVAWITERKNVLMGFFYLSAVWGWLRFIDDKSARPWRFYVLALGCQALALFAKTTACTLPVAMILILWLEQKRIDRRRMAQVVPFLLMAVGMGLVTMWWERFHQNTRGEMFGMDVLDRVLLAGRAFWFYLGKLVWPVNLTFSYPRWTISAANPIAYLWVFAILALALVIWRVRQWTGRSVEVAMIYFAATLAPTLGFIMLFTFVYSFVADHYQYMACIGPLALCAAGITLGLERAGKLVLQPALYGLLLLTLGALTWQQCETYKNLETLWQTTIDHNPTSWLALNDLGVILYNEGKTDQAIALYRKASVIGAGNAETHNNFGAVLDRKGQLAEAAAEFEKALSLRPDFAEAHRNLGDVLMREGRLNEAGPHFMEAIRLRPDLPKPHYSLGLALIRAGQLGSAIDEFEKALALQPDSPEFQTTLVNIAWRLATSPGDSVRDGKKAVRLASQINGMKGGNDPLTITILAAAYAEAGQFDQAVAAARQALDLAQARKMEKLAGILRGQIKLYQARKPFRDAAGMK